jgi:hypothetical protein
MIFTRVQRGSVFVALLGFLSCGGASRPAREGGVAVETADSGQDGGGDQADGAEPGTGSHAVDGAETGPQAPCGAGEHVCGGSCARDTDVVSCGTSCTPCPAIRRGSSTCDGKRCGARCPDGFVICRDRCIPSGESCSESCGANPSAPLTCGQTCVANGPNSCCSQPERCGAFGCRENRCLTACQGDQDCAPGQSCNRGTGQCGPCGALGEFCCWDAAYAAYECAAEGTYCLNMKCVKVPPG